MASIAQRGVGAIVGTLVADAASAPLHWIYDTEKMRTILEENPSPAFLPKSYGTFYSIPTGRNTCYGEQMFTLLKSICDNKGINVAEYKKSLLEKFGPKSDYEVNLGHPITKADYPINGPWRHNSIKVFIKNYEDKQEKTGAEDDPQSDGFSKVAPVVALHAGNTSKMLESLEQVIRVTQEDPMAVKCSLAAARVLEKCILGNSIKESIEDAGAESGDPEVKGYIKKVLDARSTDHITFVKGNGSSCRVPGNFMNALHCMLQSDGNFKATFETTLPPGGCNCSRLCFVGACLGAVYGLESIPSDWIDKTNVGRESVKLAQQLVGLRK